MLNTPESFKKVRDFCSFSYDQKYVDLAEDCNDKAQGKLNFYYGSPLVLFVAYDKNACWTNPQNGKTSEATDPTIVATHMMLEAASLNLAAFGSVILMKKKQENCFACLKAGNRCVCFISAILQRILCQTQS